MINQLLPDAWVHAGGWTLLHSLWQGALITLLLVVLLRRLRRKAPALRYHLSVGALFLLMLCVAGTFYYYYEPAGGGTSDVIGSIGGALLNEALPNMTSAVALTFWERLESILPLLIEVWFIGFILMGLRMIAEWTYLQHLRSFRTQAVDLRWQQQLNDLKEKMGVRQQVKICESLRISTPILLGWIRPVILLPVGLLINLSPQQVECILAHELAHVRRMDYLVNMLQSVVEVVLFFHPAVWWISAQIREEREHCCDELAAEITGDRLLLVRTLAQLEQWRLQPESLALAFTGRPQGLLGRVQRLLGGDSPVRLFGKGVWGMLIISIALGLTSFRHQVTAEDVGALPIPALSQEVSTNPYSTERPAMTARSGSVSELNKYSASEPLLNPLPSLLSRPIKSQRDTLPDEKLEQEMRKLEQEMRQLEQEMRQSPEMRELEQLTRQFEEEMRKFEKEFKFDNSEIEKLMQERQAMEKDIMKRHQELTNDPAFKQYQEEMTRFSREFQRQVEEIEQRYKGQPEMIGQKVDSLSRGWEEKFSMREKEFEEKYEAAFEKMEKEMEALFESEDWKRMEAEIEEKVQNMYEPMQEKMESLQEPFEERMEQLQKQIEEKYEVRFEELQRKMEELQRKHQKRGQEE